MRTIIQALNITGSGYKQAKIKKEYWQQATTQNPEPTEIASLILDTEVEGLLCKGDNMKVDLVHGQVYRTYLAIPKPKIVLEYQRPILNL